MVYMQNNVDYMVSLCTIRAGTMYSSDDVTGSYVSGLHSLHTSSYTGKSHCGEWVECMGMASGCGYQEVGVASGSGWNLWVWLAGSGCG